MKRFSKLVDPRKVFHVGQHGIQLRCNGITAGELRVEPFRCVEFFLDFLHPLFCCRQIQNGCSLLILVVHEQADHIGNFSLRLVVWQRLQFLRADNVAVRGERTGFTFAHLFADFGVIQEGIGAVRQGIQILPKAVFHIEFSEIFVRMHICKHMAAIHIVGQHHQLLHRDGAAVLLHMLVDLHLQESFQRRFLIAIQLTELLCQGIELEDGHTLVQMRGEIVKAIEFIHLPVDITRRLRVNLLKCVHHLILADRERQLHAAFIARCAAYQIDLTYFAQGSFLLSVPAFSAFFQ